MHSYRIAVGSDDAAFEYRRAIVADLEKDERVVSVEDFGVHEDNLREFAYPEVAVAVAEAVAAGRADRGILMCGTGIGVAIAANKVTGIRATVAHDSYSVERSIMSNDCQILTMGQRVIGLEVARRLVREWLGYEFDPSSRSGAKVAIIEAYEKDHPTSLDTLKGMSCDID
ncbi:MAG: ribose-5-phosphate isomerase [Acidimicrobiia bacterium]